MAGTQAGLIVSEDDIECPVEAILDSPVPADGLGGGLGGEVGRGDVIAGIGPTAILEFGSGPHLDDRRDAGQTEFAGEVEALMAAELGESDGGS